MYEIYFEISILVKEEIIILKANGIKIGWVLIIIFFIIVLISVDIPILFENYIQKRYHTIEMSNKSFLENNNNIKDFENHNGRLKSTSNDPWIVYNPNDVNLDNIIIVKINVKYLSKESMPSEFYIKNSSYHCINFEIKEGINEFTIPKDFYDGTPITELRFDLLTQENEEVEIDNIVFNNSQDLIKNHIIKPYKLIIAKIMLLLLLSVVPLLVFKLGLQRKNINKYGFTILLCSLIGARVLYNFNFKDNIFYFLCISIFIILIGILGYWLLTKILLKAYGIIGGKIKIDEKIILIITFMFLCFSIFSQINIIYIYIAFYPFYLFGFKYNDFKIDESKNDLLIKIIITLGIVLLSLLILKLDSISSLWDSINSSEMKLNIIAIVLINWFIEFCMLSIKNIRKLIEKSKIFSINKFCLFFLVYIFSMILNAEIYGITYAIIFFLIHLALRKNIILTYSEQNTDKIVSENNLKQIYLDKEIKCFFTNLCVILMTTIFFESFVQYYIAKSNINEIINYTYGYVSSIRFVFNLILVSIIYYLFRFMFGNKLGKVLFSILCSVVFIGNFIKLRYQDTLLKPIDFLQVKELISISKSFISTYILIILIGAILVSVILFVKFRYNVIAFLKPAPNILMTILMIISLLFFINCIEKGAFTDVNITASDGWRGDDVRIGRQGFFIYNYFNIKSINDIKVSKPENYNEKIMFDIKKESENLSDNKNKSGIKPNVIVVMEESMFDMQKLDEIKFSKDIDSNIKKYQKATTISPRYGGGTASVEFEALTGFSNIFFVDNVVQYSTYWNSPNDKIPSIAKEFHKNGYATTAIHPNGADFYNRNIVYNAMGFDKFLNIKDFSENSQQNARGYILDSEVNKMIDKQLNSTDESQFIFAVTIENHGAYNSEKIRNDIELSSDKLSKEQIDEAEVYAEGLYDADNFIDQLIQMVKNTDKPTIVYVWGDHLPALSFLDESGFLKDVNNKYSTPLVAYSNFKDININSQYITPNQIAPQVIKDAGISYSSYFDYIYNLRKKYPVIHKESGVNMDDEMIKKYELLQYDLLFGDKYLLD